jgi:hypothetical protein
VHLSERTIERWLYAWRRGGFTALRPGDRSDSGTSRSIRPELAERIVALKKSNMRRSVRRIIRILERLGEARRDELKRSTVHRLLAAHGISHLEVRGTARRPPTRRARSRGEAPGLAEARSENGVSALMFPIRL